MESKTKTTEKILLKLLKEPFTKHTATSLASALNLSRQGLWKSLNKLSKNKLIALETIGETKKSAVTISLEWKNQVTIKTLSLLLTKESSEHERWKVNFSQLENNTEFIILFGSILHSPKNARDIDILAVVNSKNDFKRLDEAVIKIQKTQEKKIHLIDLTNQEFKTELRKQNKAYIDSLKKGIVLNGQDNYIRFLEDLKRK
ncbi:hypothetical protein COU57_01570 [Candidatus Pacearchaeota archaeon CG10_big_fil_rev_8_21_14_0_10_32_14]|nr:MAG: hypothetical protein COU57_01570 [Candidatus Pacearchaeota archaeon CG10_big_fil_rev_8_21_14_0_10_32_14]